MAMSGEINNSITITSAGEPR